MDIKIAVKNKTPVYAEQTIVCNNSDYTVTWDLDEEWSEYDTKTMRCVYMDGTYADTVFSGATCALPVVTVPGVVQVGLYAGDIRTSRMAVLRALPSALTSGGAPADPPESVYNQLMERMNALETPDWNQNDPEAKDYIKNRTHWVDDDGTVHTIDPTYIGLLDPSSIGDISGETLSVSGTVEFASDSWASDYSSFKDSWLTNHASSGKISIEINGNLIENLPYSGGSYGAFTLGNVDTLGVAITNSGYGTSTQRVKVSATMFPDGIKTARVFRKATYRIPVEALPENVQWLAETTKSDFVFTDNEVYVNDHEQVQQYKANAATSSNPFNVIKHTMCLICYPEEKSHFDIYGHSKVNVRNYTGTKLVNVFTLEGRQATEDDWPKGATLLGIDFSSNVVLLNPRRDIIIIPSSTENSTKKFRITVDDSGTISATEVTT